MKYVRTRGREGSGKCLILMTSNADRLREMWRGGPISLKLCRRPLCKATKAAGRHKRARGSWLVNQRALLDPSEGAGRLSSKRKGQRGRKEGHSVLPS